MCMCTNPWKYTLFTVTYYCTCNALFYSILQYEATTPRTYCTYVIPLIRYNSVHTYRMYKFLYSISVRVLYSIWGKRSLLFATRCASGTHFHYVCTVYKLHTIQHYARFNIEISFAWISVIRYNTESGFAWISVIRYSKKSLKTISLFR